VAYSRLGIRLLWLIPSHIALITDLVEYLVGSIPGWSAGHNCDKRTDPLSEKYVLPRLYTAGWVKDETAKDACEFGRCNLLRRIRRDQQSLIPSNDLIVG